MKLKELIKELEKLSPVQYALEWDNVGLLVGDDEQEVHRVMIALDASDFVIEQAVEQEVDLLLTHHPMIFRPMKTVNNHSMNGRRVLKLAENHIAYYAMHTNFDVKGGMAELAADKLSLRERTPLEITLEEQGVLEGIGRTGFLTEAMTISQVAELVKQEFGLENVMLYGDPERVVKKVAVCPGSGKSVIGNALSQEVELLISGDISHHEGIDAVDQGLCIMDATHYGLEHIFIEYMESYLQGLSDQDDLDTVCLDTGCPITIL